ncbi:MAG TPA: asparagine synthase (glutamine-hydrolyzing) [Alphaproteobacteria bacterium]|nr:asparagine synthase (glutamine-hydrolyzing) [Alphaproteobacteria bacterium]
MCGLVGVLDLQRRFAAGQGEHIVKDMAAAIHYRGPDMDGYWSSADNLCHLGHKRLSIIDLSPAGRQPMADDSGRYVIVFNGEIYNFKELRDQLAATGVTFRSKSDTEVLLKGYIKFGPALFAQLDGQFALAIYDTETRGLVLARDRAGEKPLYYRAEPGLIAFASELHALTKVPGLDWNLSAGAVALYMLYRYVPAPQSILAGVRKLKPGCMLLVDAQGQIEERRYYAFEVNPDPDGTKESFLETCDRVEDAMLKSLRGRLISDVPVGMFLSSGIDSSVVCGLAVRKLGIVPRTFTVGFEGDVNSEHEIARETAEHLGTQHTQHVFSAADFDAIGRNMGALLDEPNGDRSCVPTYLLCKFAREQVTVAISGDGGDELFAGYDRYGPMSDAFQHPASVLPSQIIGTYYNQALPVFGYDGATSAFPDMRPAIEAELDLAQPLFQHPDRPILHGLRQLDFNHYMPGAVLAKVDRMSMRNSLEVRTPFFHPELLGEAAHLPFNYCFNGKRDGEVSDRWTKKMVLRAVTERNLPQSVAPKIAWDQPKRGFGMPASVFLNNQAAVQQEMRAALDALSALRFFQERKNALQAMAAAAVKNINAAWAFIVFGQWAAHFPARL